MIESSTLREHLLSAEAPSYELRFAAAERIRIDGEHITELERLVDHLRIERAAVGCAAAGRGQYCEPVPNRTLRTFGPCSVCRGKGRAAAGVTVDCPRGCRAARPEGT